MASSRLSHQYQHLDYLAHNQANLTTPGFMARDSGYRQGEFSSWLRERGGSVAATDNPLDVALPERAYLQIETAQGTRLTRRGDLRLDEQNRLVVGMGWPVLSDSGNPIVVPAGRPRVTADGTVFDGGQAVGRMARVTTDSVDGQGSWLVPGQGLSTRPDTRDLLVSQLESSNVETAEEQSVLVNLIQRTKVLGELVQTQDQILEKAIREIGRGR
ncbi:hypothetical protein IV102_34930 [bacterium]|nr:hypothetical protein [bacterium]